MPDTKLLGVLCLAVATAAGAQQPPSTDIWIVPLTVSGGQHSAGAPRNLTARAGYDNQPAWSPRGDVIYFSSARGDGQNDIWSVDAATGRQTRVTNTAPESEYSPTVVAGGGALSVIRVERDSAQRLWRIPLDGAPSSVILANIKPVGYHAWGDAGALALFVLGSPNSLQIADSRTGTATVATQRIGRALARIPGTNAVSFVDKSADQEWWITKYDFATAEMTRIARTLPGVEDYAWAPDGALLCGREGHLFQWTRSSWVEIADLTEAGVRNITRMAVSPRGDALAFVAADKVP
jgi:dipeptidyl aminopeptidase/acylaminoacyl peptidase